MVSPFRTPRTQTPRLTAPPRSPVAGPEGGVDDSPALAIKDVLGGAPELATGHRLGSAEVVRALRIREVDGSGAVQSLREGGAVEGWSVLHGCLEYPKQ